MQIKRTLFSFCRFDFSVTWPASYVTLHRIWSLQTTGMDPITRRHVWDIILKAKRGRAIILTTHSMEEADVLSDRIGIMANGKLQCIGTSSRLKSRFGTGFVLHVNFVGSSSGQTTPDIKAIDTAKHETVKQFFKSVS